MDKNPQHMMENGGWKWLNMVIENNGIRIGIYPKWWWRLHFANLNMAKEIVEFPMKDCDFP